MKAYTVSLAAAEGLPVELEPYPHVPVGEGGRGRVLTRVALGVVDFSQKVLESMPAAERRGLLRRVDFLKTKKGTLLVVKERRGDDRRAAVLLAVPAGYRGRTSVAVSPIGEKDPCPYRGRGFDLDMLTHKMGSTTRCTLCGATFVGYMRHPDEGVADRWVPFGEHQSVTVLAEGVRAQGLAGKMGGHREYLVVMQPGARVAVRRYGRLYGAPPVLHVVWDGADLHVGPPDVVEMEAGDPPDEEGAELL